MQPAQFQNEVEDSMLVVQKEEEKDSDSEGESNNPPSQSSLLATATSVQVVARSAHTSLKRARILFDDDDDDHGDDGLSPPQQQQAFAAAVVPWPTDPGLRQISLQRRRRQRMMNAGLPTATAAPPPAAAAAAAAIASSSIVNNSQSALVVFAAEQAHQQDSTKTVTTDSSSLAAATTTMTTTTTGTLALIPAAVPSLSQPVQTSSNNTGNRNRILVSHSSTSLTGGGSGGMVNIPVPTWHAPWKLATVLSSHLGWVRCISFDTVNNRIFATGSADRTIKIWNTAMASVGANSALQMTLTGHISPVRGLAFSEQYPYLFSCAEDKQVKCWDLHTNQVVRHYHGHLSGVYCLALHPTLSNILITGGRDAVARVWDIRTKAQIHTLAGHNHTVSSILTQSLHPQVITSSHDCTIKLWDLAAGKVYTTLTHHSKAVRALTQPSFERTFCSGSADGMKQWQGADGRFIKTLSYRPHNTIIHALSINDDGVLASGGDNGSMHFTDYRTGYTFQADMAIPQPGSLTQAENAVMALQFDMTGTLLVTGEADKTIKIWKTDPTASELTHPIDMTAWRKHCIAASKQRY